MLDKFDDSNLYDINTNKDEDGWRDWYFTTMRQSLDKVTWEVFNLAKDNYDYSRYIRGDTSPIEIQEKLMSTYYLLTDLYIKYFYRVLKIKCHVFRFQARKFLNDLSTKIFCKSKSMIKFNMLNDNLRYKHIAYNVANIFYSNWLDEKKNNNLLIYF